jgi:hypothetical protein
MQWQEISGAEILFDPKEVLLNPSLLMTGSFFYHGKKIRKYSIDPDSHVIPDLPYGRAIHRLHCSQR